jgi:hypothetical protein
MEKITLYYFIAGGSLTLARGENVKLFLVDAGLDHEYIRIQNREKEWPPMKEQLIQDGYYAASVPYIKLGDKVFGRTIPIMRYLSIKLGRKYHGTNDEEDYHLDVVSDLTNDWFESLKNAFRGDEVSWQGGHIRTGSSKDDSRKRGSIMLKLKDPTGSVNLKNTIQTMKDLTSWETE